MNAAREPTRRPADRQADRPADRPGRLAVGIIGAGRVGAVLGAPLATAGNPIVAVSAISAASLRRREQLLPGVEIRPVDQVGPACDLLMLAVPDDALPSLIAGLVEAGGIRRGQFVVHTSGRYGIDVLQPATDAGGLPLALHPVMTFTGTSIDLERISGVCFGVTAPELLRPVAETLVLEIGGDPVWIAEENRPLYHAALAHASNHLVTLVASSMDLLRAAGADDPQRMLGPLLSAALDNALRYGDSGLTGPVVRGDSATVRKHLDVIAATSPEINAAYVAMARLTADRALAAGLLAPETAVELLDVLAGRREAAE